MYAFDRLCSVVATCRICRVLAACLLAVAVVAAGPAFAQSKPAKPKHESTALPEPLTHESIRELVSRLSDEDVRKLLISQLDRSAASSKGKGDQAMSGMVEANAGMVRARLGELRDAFYALRNTVSEVITKLDEPEGPSALPLIGLLIVAMFLIAWAVERLYHYALRNYRSRLAPVGDETFGARVFRRGASLALDLVGILVFALAALAFFLALWQGHGLRRIAIVEFLIAVVIVRVTWLFARFLLAKRGGEERLLPFADVPAGQLRRFAVALAVIWSAMHGLATIFAHAGVGQATVDLLVLVFSVFGLAVALWTVVQVRAPIAAMIRGNGKHSAVVSRLADLWPVIAIVFFVGIVAARVYNILAGTPVEAGAGILSVLLVVTLPIVDMLLCRAVAAGASRTAPEGAVAPGFVAAYENVFRRAVHIVVTVVGLFLLALLWDVDVFAVAQASMGGKISSSLFGICIVLLLAYLVWEIAKTAIDRRLAAEGKQGPDVPASRLQTLLPLLRGLIFVTIVVMATMSFLAALGVDILPLLAGASVVGVAIGFGSQTLVRDIVSGAFFLMDDAFRLGEYIEVGQDKGVVEKINVRSVFLRHHRGALNILPYGEIKRLRNTSRDWIIHVMEFRLTYDTNIQTVKKIMKKIGEEMKADPDYAGDMLQPLKSQGVLATEDSAMVIRAKFTAKPGGNSFVIRRVAYDKIIKAFREAGIKFAHKEVTVNIPRGFDDDEEKAIAGAAARAATAEAPKPATDDARG